jgi:hypothetical protein
MVPCGLLQPDINPPMGPTGSAAGTDVGYFTA